MILVTGGTGLLGSHLLYRLTTSNESVNAIYRKKSSIEKTRKVFGYYPQPEAHFKNINWIKADVTDIPSLESAFEGIEKLYHCAAIVSFNPNHKRKIFNVNFEGTENVVNTALDKGVKKLCYSSSVAALGSRKNGKYIDENTAWETNINPSNYSTSKHLAEMEVWRGIEEGLNAVIVNPSTIIGPGDWSDGSPALIRQLDEGLRFYTEGSSGFVDVRDVVDVMVRLMEADINREQYLISSENISFKSLFNMIAEELNKKKPDIKAGSFLTKIVWRTEKFKSKITGKEPVITKESAKMAHEKDRFSNQKIKEELGKEFNPVEDAIKYTCEKYLKENKKA